MNFSGKASLITGASQGLGEAIATELARSGAEVILVDIQEEKLREVAGRIEQERGKASFYKADVSKMEQVQKTVEEVLQNHPKIDHLVNNAGINRDNLLVRMKEEEWNAVLAVNLNGIFNLSKAVIRHMMGNRFGRIVNISSVVGLMGNPGQTNYAASKAGVIGFTKALAREVASRGITVNAVAPGYIATPMTEKLPESIKKVFIDLIPIKRFGTPEEVAQAVKFLLSDEAAYITGQVISVNGGMYM
ncbi:3-oxoacyl-ACP synthase [candidate division WOR-1 bacterium DG_54_3]|uniref:3-oxoacyl-[acyl-carrier-protein] reductase n=1 Tax=candidate division WOR-1 bacterium DG_54_3 TaxID=1703775 RepID=A0A0S7Y668_UNCSA|nr:MAG: 3-oxoacyl-ACP synthase [candidate division WOR-1 bacterium DG_54_3]